MSIKRALLLLLLVVSAAFALLQVQKVPMALQYAFAAPKMTMEEKQPEENTDSQQQEQQEQKKEEPKDSELTVLLKRLDGLLRENPGLSDARMAEGYLDGAQLKTPSGGGVTARVIGLWGDTYMHPAPVLTAGRLLYPEELESGQRAAVLDEQTAVKLFRSGAPVGESFLLGEKEFRVVGVIRHARTPGEKEALRVQVPLKSLDQNGIQAQMLAVSLRVIPGQGAAARLKTLLENWQTGGALYQGSKERYRSLLPVRWLLCALGALALALMGRMLAQGGKFLYAAEKQRLQREYAAKRLPMWLLKGAGLLALWGLWLAGVYLVFSQAVAPVYIFPEWVPPVLVEWKDLSATFWNNRTAATTLTEIRTPQVLELRFYHRLLTALCAGIFLLLLKPFGLLRARVMGK